MTAIYYDTEFLEDGKTIDLISIGMVRDDGVEYYAVNSDANWERVVKHPWLIRNVVPNLPLRNRKGLDDWLAGDGRHEHLPVPKSLLVGVALDVTDTRVKPRQVIANEVRDFIVGTDPSGAIPHVNLWAWYAAYDHVALCQLWGPMIALPKGVPMYTHDLKQECDRLGNPAMPEQAEGEHNALADARHVRVMAEYLRSLGGEGR